MATIYVQRVLDTGLGQTVTYESVTVSMPTGPTVPPGVGPYDASTHTIVQRYDNAEPGIWPPVAIIADLPTVNVNEGDQCWVIAENAMYYANADGGSWDVASGGGGGGGVKPYTYTIGCSAAPYNDTLDVCDFLDPGDGTGIAACLAICAEFKDTVKLRPGYYTIDPALVTLPMVIRSGCTLEGSGSSSIITITSGAGGYSQHVFTVNYNSTLKNMAFFIDPAAADTISALQHIQCAPICTVENIKVYVTVGPEPHSALSFIRSDVGPASFSNISIEVEDGFTSTFVFAAIMIGNIAGSSASSENVTPPTISNLSVNGDIFAVITVDASMGVVINNLTHVNLDQSSSMAFLVNEPPQDFVFRGPLVTNALIQFTPTSVSTSFAISVANTNTGPVLGSAFSNVTIIGGEDESNQGFNINTDTGSVSGFFVSNYTTCRIATMLHAQSFNNGVISGIKMSNHSWTGTEPTARFEAYAYSAIVGVDMIACDVEVVQTGDVSRLRVIGGEGDVTLDVSGTDNMVVAHHAASIADDSTGAEVAHVPILPPS